MPTNDITQARWEGKIEGKVEDSVRRLDTINGDVREIKVAMNSLDRKVSTLVDQRTTNQIAKTSLNTTRLAVLIVVATFLANLAIQALKLG